MRLSILSQFVLRLSRLLVMLGMGASSSKASICSNQCLAASLPPSASNPILLLSFPIFPSTKSSYCTPQTFWPVVLYILSLGGIFMTPLEPLEWGWSPLKPSSTGQDGSGWFTWKGNSANHGCLWMSDIFAWQNIFVWLVSHFLPYYNQL